MKSDSSTSFKVRFQRFSQKVSGAMGSVWAFMTAVAIVVIWACFGPGTHYSEMWQMIINTGTTIITFLMVFLIQNTQNRDSKAIHLKLDELIRAISGARNNMVDLENCTEEACEILQKEFVRLRKKEVTKAERRGEIPPGEARALEDGDVCEAASEQLQRDTAKIS